MHPSRDIKTQIDSRIIYVRVLNKQETNNTKIYVDLTNLPAKLNRDKRSLLPTFLDYRSKKKNPEWHYDKAAGEYLVKVDGRKIRPAEDNFLFPMEEKKVTPGDSQANVWPVAPPTGGTGTAGNEVDDDDSDV